MRANKLRQARGTQKPHRPQIDLDLNETRHLLRGETSELKRIGQLGRGRHLDLSSDPDKHPSTTSTKSMKDRQMRNPRRREQHRLARVDPNTENVP